MLVEAARIAREPVADLKDIKPMTTMRSFCLGVGAAKNLNTFISRRGCSIDPEMERCSRNSMAPKPIGAVCIAPAVVVRALGKGIVTIGSDADTLSNEQWEVTTWMCGGRNRCRSRTRL